MIKLKHFFYTTFIIVSALVLMYSFKDKEPNMIVGTSEYSALVHYPACLQMYYSIEKYSEKYNIPKQYAYGIAYKETGYKSPFQWGYNAGQISPTGALGPMQILLSTAKWVWNDNSINKDKMLNNIEFNVETSMKYLAMLHKQYRDWKIVFGFYNTGYPIINTYALNVYQHKT